MNIALGSDHRGILVKNSLISTLQELNIKFGDFGTIVEGEPVDYPDYAEKVCKLVQLKEFDYGVLVCYTGIGMSMSANKMKGIRAALCSDVTYAEMARLHNDANVLCLAAREGSEKAKEILKKFLTTSFEGGRHSTRVVKMMALEGK